MNGPTKNNRQMGAKVDVACAGTTSSRIEAGLWMERYVRELSESGVTSGYLYTLRPGQRSKLADFSEVFYEPLESIQKELNSVIPADLDVRKEHGLWRSIRKGVTAHTSN